jgi:glycosyltransferase involved in cell wall biosynthesis
MPFATRLIANSEHARRWLRRRYRPASRVMTIPNGLDVEFYARTRDVAAKRRGLGLSDDEGPVLGMVARLRPEKDHATLLHATALLVNRYPKLVLLLAGDGPRQAELERMAARMLPTGCCRFLGNRADVADLHHVFDVSLLITEYEGLSNVVMEAMAAARPVVATNVEGCAELIDDGVNGLLVPPHDAPALADAVARVLDDEALARRLGEAGQRAMREQYSLRKLVERHEALYEALMARHRRRDTRRTGAGR